MSLARWVASQSSADAPIAHRSRHLRRREVAVEEQVHLRSKTRRERVRRKRNEQGKKKGGLGGLGVVAVHRDLSLTPAVEAELRPSSTRPGGAQTLWSGVERREGCGDLIGAETRGIYGLKRRNQKGVAGSFFTMNAPLKTQ